MVHTTWQSFLKAGKYDAWLDVSADADPKRLLQKAQLVANSGTLLRSLPLSPPQHISSFVGADRVLVILHLEWCW